MRFRLLLSFLCLAFFYPLRAMESDSDSGNGVKMGETIQVGSLEIAEQDGVNVKDTLKLLED